MNSCILMAEIVQEPQLRYTTDQLAITEMLVQFPGIRAEDPPATLKVVGWGNLAQELQQNYHQGDRVIIEGRLSMNTVERAEGFKEKRAEMTVQKIHPLGDSVSLGSSATASANTSNTTATANRSAQSTATTINSHIPEKVTTRASNVSDRHSESEAPVHQPKPNYPMPNTETDVDDIPFVRSVDSRTASSGLLDFYEIESQCPQVGISHNFKFI